MTDRDKTEAIMECLERLEEQQQELLEEYGEEILARAYLVRVAETIAMQTENTIH